ncbi:MAG: 4'-phosphopantetheinyl transferase superfamily protein [Kofleriaceae bacterium]
MSEGGFDARFVIEHALLEPGEDSHAVGRELAARAVAQIGATLEYQGTRPIAVLASPAHELSPELAGSISLTHTRTQVFAVAARVAKLGIDLVDYDDARIARIAERFLTDEHDAIERHVERLLADGHDALARSLGADEAAARADARQRARAMCFAAKEAGLKALGLGLLDGGVLDGTSPVRVVELGPPRYAPLASGDLELALHDVGFSVLAIAHA